MMILDLESLPERGHARWGCRWLGWCFALLILVILPPSARAQSEAGSASGSPGKACTQLVPLENFNDELASAEEAVRKTPGVALQRLQDAEALLPCLAEAVAPKALSDVYRLRAVGSLLMKNRGTAQEAFVRAVALNPQIDCPASLTGYGNNTFTRDAIGLCNVARSAVMQSLVGIEFTNHKSLEKLYLNGVERNLDESAVYLEVAPGKHLLQIVHRDGFKGMWIEVKPPLDEDARAQRFDLTKLGLVAEKKTVVDVGAIRIDGLVQGAEVVLDGRTRQDLPVLRNVEVGERHLMIRLPDGSVLGGTVAVKANEETVYKVNVDTGGFKDSGGGFSLDRNKVLGFGTVGLAVLAGAGSGLTFRWAFDRYASADEAKATYDALGAGSADFSSPFNEALTYQAEGNRYQTIGWVLGGVAVAAIGAGTYFLFIADSGDDEFARLEPWIAPVPGRDGEKGGVALGLHGRF